MQYYSLILNHINQIKKLKLRALSKSHKSDKQSPIDELSLTLA